MLEIQIIHELVCVCSLIVHPYTSFSLYQHFICSSSLFCALISITGISAHAYLFVPFLLVYLMLSSWLSTMAFTLFFVVQPFSYCHSSLSQPTDPETIKKEMKEYQTFQLPYTDKAKIDHLAHLAGLNVSMNKDHILKEIKKAVQRRSAL